MKSLSELSYQTETHTEIYRTAGPISAPPWWIPFHLLKLFWAFIGFHASAQLSPGHAGAWTRTLELILKKRELAVWGEALRLSVLRGLTWPQVQVRLSLAVNSVAWRGVRRTPRSAAERLIEIHLISPKSKRQTVTLEVLVLVLFLPAWIFPPIIKKTWIFFSYSCSLSVISLHGNSNCNIWSLCQR